MNLLKSRIGFALALVAGMLVCGVATATPVTMNFDRLTPGTSVDTYYDGGCSTRQHRSSTQDVDCNGPDYGVTWKHAQVGTLPAGANIPSAPNYIGVGLFSIEATMNVAAGFDTGLSFYYSTGLVPGGIGIYSGRNGHGTLLASSFLTWSGVMCGNLPCWDFVDLSFSGVAKSAIFYGITGSIGFDDVTLGASTPVPEPAAFGIFGLGLLLIGAFVGLRRRMN